MVMMMMMNYNDLLILIGFMQSWAAVALWSSLSVALIEASDLKRTRASERSWIEQEVKHTHHIWLVV